jgi:cell division protein FtsB
VSPSRVSPLSQRRAFVAAALVIGAFVLFFPARQLIAQRARIDELAERRSALRAENARLSAEANRLADPNELEVEARDRLGLVRPGERAYYIQPSEAAGAESTSERSPGLWSRAWSWLSSLIRGRSSR